MKTNYSEAHNYAKTAKQKLTYEQFIEKFPMPIESARYILKRYRHIQSPPRGYHDRPCTATLDKSINYNDTYRRAATRERLRGRNG